MRLFSLTLPFLAILSPTFTYAANGILYTDSVTYCAEARAVVVEEFDIAYHQSNSSLTFSFSLASVESNLNVSANLYLNAYGIQVLNKTLDLCSYFEGVICPLPQVNFTGYGTYPIPSRYLDNIPGIGFTVPNLEAYARIELLRDGTGEPAACLQATLSNGKTTRIKAVAYATGFLTLAALLVGLFHAGAVTSPSPAQYRWFDMLYLFQTAAATGLLHLNYPLVYSNFVENFSWAMGLFHSRKMQDSINSMRAKTGGSLNGDADSGVQYINRKLSPYNLAVNFTSIRPNEFRSLIATNTKKEWTNTTHNLYSRASIDSRIDSTNTSQIETGLPVYVETSTIPEANAYTTVFFWMLAFVAIAIAFHVVLFLVVLVVERFTKRDSWAARLRRTWWDFCGGNALRLCLIWFLPVWIFGFWQFNIVDSKLAIFFAFFGLVLTLVPLATVFVLSILYNRHTSSTAPGISPLYTSYRYFHSIGTLYRPYRQKYHFFWFILITAMIARAGFIAFGNDQAWTQVIGNVVIEGLVLLSLLIFRPHKDRKGDWLGVFLSLMRLIAWGLLIAFIPSVGLRAIPRTVIGLVIVVCFGIPTIVLLLGLIWSAGYGYLWKRHTHRIEDGLEVERFVADDDSGKHPEMTQTHIDANNFVTGAGGGRDVSMASMNNSDPATSLGRRTSVLEPIGDNTYESSHGHGNGYGNGYGSEQRYSAAAYEQAASGEGWMEGVGHGYGARSPTSRPGSRLSGYGSGVASPVEDGRWG